MRDDRPESMCRRCDGENIVWVAPSPLWNAVMRVDPDGPEPFGGIICPTCFAVMAEFAGVAREWRLIAESTIDLPTTSPDGRVWNPETWMWEAAANV